MKCRPKKLFVINHFFSNFYCTNSEPLNVTNYTCSTCQVSFQNCIEKELDLDRENLNSKLKELISAGAIAYNTNPVPTVVESR